MAVVNMLGKSHEKVGSYEYRMSRAMFNEINKKRSGVNKNMNPWTYALKVVNDEFNIKGKVTKIILVDE